MRDALLIMLGVVTVYGIVGAVAAYLRGRRVRLARVEAPVAPTPEEVPVTWPTVTVLIPAWRDAAVLERCFNSIRQVDYQGAHFVLIAGGPDGEYGRAVELAGGLPQYTVIPQQGNGKNAALADGLAAAKGETIVVLDADSVVEPGWLNALIRPIAAGEASATCGSFVPLERTWVSATEQLDKLFNYEILNRCVLQGSSSIAVRRDALDQAGGFPREVRVGVDWDLDFRLGQIGCPKKYVAGAVVHTHRMATLHDFWTTEVRWRRGLFQVLRRRGVPLLNISRYRWFWVCAAYAGLVLSVGLAAPFDLRMAGWLGGLLGCVTLWIIVRRARIPCAVAGYLDDRSHLRLLFAPGLLQVIAMFATMFALATRRRISALFKGPRPAMPTGTSVAG